MFKQRTELSASSDLSDPRRSEDEEAVYALARQVAGRMGLRGDDLEDCAISFVEHAWEHGYCQVSNSGIAVGPPRILRAYAKNWTVDFIRRCAVRRRHETPICAVVEGHGTDSDEVELQRDSPDIASAIALRIEIEDAVSQLNDAQKRLLVRIIVQGDQVDVVAVDEGTTVNAIHQRLHTVRMRLRKILSSAQLDRWDYRSHCGKRC